MGTLVYNLYVLSSILGPPLWRIMTCAQGPHMAKSGPAPAIELSNFGLLVWIEL